MQSLAAGAMMIGLIFFFALSAPVFERAGLKAEAEAVNFINYRNAVNDYALEHKTAGSIPSADLVFPEEFSPMRWENMIVWEDNELRCYVWGPGSPELVAAVLRLMHDSPAFGWNRNGRLVNNGGSSLLLPDMIGDRDIVSVIVVDRVDL